LEVFACYDDAVSGRGLANMRRFYEFGEYQLDVSAFELRRAGTRVEVQPKMLRLLCHLIECRERAVGSDELMRLLWPDETVGSGSLKRAVCGARQAIGERGGRDSRIRTVHRVGYQFVGSLRENVLPGTSQPAPQTAAAPRASTPSDLQWGAVAGDAELLELLQRAVTSAKPSVCCVVISSSAAGAGRTYTLERLLAVARPLGVGTWIARCGPRMGARDEEVFAQLVKQAANARGPVIIGIDDVHHADVTALRRLRAQLQEWKGVRVLLIATCRPLGTHAEVEALCAELPTLRISLTGMSPADLRRYVAFATGRAPSDRLINTLHNLSAGNPLFLRILLAIWRVEGRRTWTDLVRPMLEREGSTGVFELVAHYIRLLPESSVRMLHIAALLGMSFSAERLAALTLMRAEDQAQALTQASAAGLITQYLGNRDTYRFVHAAVRAAVQAQPSAPRSGAPEPEPTHAWHPKHRRAAKLGRWGAEPRELRISASRLYSSRATKHWDQEMGAVNEDA
jgi:DNA-binding winged helix-turn-helix (wHTH) protein